MLISPENPIIKPMITIGTANFEPKPVTGMMADRSLTGAYSVAYCSEIYAANTKKQ
jgi:hypothetical protein